MTVESQSSKIQPELPPYAHTALTDLQYKQVVSTAEHSHPQFRFTEEDLGTPGGFAAKMFEQVMIMDEPQVLFAAYPYSEEQYQSLREAVTAVSQANRPALSSLAKETVAGLIMGCEELKRREAAGSIQLKNQFVPYVVEDFPDSVSSVADIEKRAKAIFGDLERKGKLDEVLSELPEARKDLYGWEMLSDLLRIYGNEFHNFLPKF